MTEKEWTPGPHKAVVGEYSTAVYGPYQRGKPGQILCEIVGDSPEADANAYLFDAAEALYAATDFIDHFCLNQTEVSDEARLTIPGPYIRALIDARRKAMEGE